MHRVCRCEIRRNPLRLDVLVESEEVGRVVGSLELDQALVVAGAVGLSDPVGSLLPEEVEIYASAGVGLHRVRRSRGPRAIRAGVRRCRPPFHTALMFTLWVASRWLKAVSSAPTRATAPPSWKTMCVGLGEVGADECSTSVSIASSGKRRRLDRLPIAVPARAARRGSNIRLQGRVRLGLEQVADRAAKLLERARRPRRPRPEIPRNRRPASRSACRAPPPAGRGLAAPTDSSKIVVSSSGAAAMNSR